MKTSPTPKRRGRKPRSFIPSFKCSVCEYTSLRYYNVTRHEFRIHSASKTQRQCCDLTFETKGDYYLHCEEYHPFLRVANRTSRLKYKIFAGCNMIGSKNSEAGQEENSKETLKIPYTLRSHTRKSMRFDNENLYKKEDSNSSAEYESLYEATRIQSHASEEESLSRDKKSFFYDVNQNNVFPEKGIRDFSDVNSSNDNYEEKYLPKKMDGKTDRESLEYFRVLNSETCDTSIALDDTDNKVRPIKKEMKIKIDTNDSIMKFENSHEEAEKFNSGDFIPAASHGLPIKKRILRDITTTYENRKLLELRKSIFDRLYRRFNTENESSFENRQKHRHVKIKKKKFQSRDVLTDIENISPSSMGDREKQIEEKRTNQNVEVLIDPRISWHDFTQVHREYICSIDFENFYKYR